MQPYHPQQPAPYGYPPQPVMQGPPPTVCGVRLEPGERVIYFHKNDEKWQRVLLIVVGLLTLVAILGIIFLLIGLNRSTPEIYVITTRRIMTLDGKLRPKFIPHPMIRKVVRQVKGASLRFVNFEDQNGNEVSFHVPSNKPGISELIQRYMQDPRAMEQAPTVPYAA